MPSLSILGREWRNHGEYDVPRWVSMLYALQPARSEDQWRAYFAWAVATGFTGVRVFAGDLDQVHQSARGARSRLPSFLDAASEYGLAVEVTAITGSVAGRYDPETHVKEIASIVRGRGNVVLELANEVGHSSQSSDVNADNLRAWGARHCHGIVWAVGAADVDEPDRLGVYPTSGGTYSTAHLNRSRSFWEEVRRIRELYAIPDATLNNEMKGAAEVDREGSRRSQPAFFAAAGALERGFGVGGVHHSTSGLEAKVPGAGEQACADAYVKAHLFVEACLGGKPGHYYNIGHTGSPVLQTPDGPFTRIYCFTNGPFGVAVQIGVSPSTRVSWANNWRPTGEPSLDYPGPDGTMLRVMPLAHT